MTVIQAAIAIGAVVFFVWLLIMPSEDDSSGSNASAEGDAWSASTGSGGEKSAKIGVGTGLMGGDIEDAAIARYALSRTKKDPKSSDARDLGTALGAQSQIDTFE